MNEPFLLKIAIFVPQDHYYLTDEEEQLKNDFHEYKEVLQLYHQSDEDQNYIELSVENHQRQYKVP